MSASAQKKQKLDQRPRDEIVIVSNMGDMRPEETVPDSLAQFCVDWGQSVKELILVPSLSGTKFLANYQYNKIDADGNVTCYGRRYVKQLIPNTLSLAVSGTGIECDVMFLLCHGNARSIAARTPAYISFLEENSVDVNGNRNSHSSHADRVYACRSYTESGEKQQTFTKPANSVHLSQVVSNAKLVVMLCCHSDDVLREYAIESEGSTTDFVFFNTTIVDETTVNIFIALLIESILRCKNRRGPWNELVKRNVCQVMLWVKQNGAGIDGAAQFWNFLRTNQIVYLTGFFYDGNNEAFQIKGSLSRHEKLPSEPLDVLEQLQTLNLRGPSCTTASHASVTYALDEHELTQLIAGTASTQPAAGPAPSLSLDALLLQLQGMMR